MKLQLRNEMEAVLHGADVAGIDASRQRQHSFYDGECDTEFGISRSHGCGQLYGS